MLIVIRCICIVVNSCWFLGFFITLCCWSFWTTRISNTSSARILWTAQLLLIECMFRIPHFRVVLSERSIWFTIRWLLGKSWRSVVWRTFVKCYWSKRLFPSHRRCVRHYRSSTAICVLSYGTKLWVPRTNTEVATIRISSVIIALTFSSSIPNLFAIRASFSTIPLGSIWCWMWIMHVSRFIRLWICSRHFLYSATQDWYMWRWRLIGADVAIICRCLCIFFNLLSVQLRNLSWWVGPIYDTFA